MTAITVEKRKFVAARLENRSGAGFWNLLGMIEVPSWPGLPSVVIWKGKTFQFEGCPETGESPCYRECPCYYAPIEVKVYEGGEDAA